MYSSKPISRRRFILTSIVYCAPFISASFRNKQINSLEALMGISPRDIIKRDDYMLHKSAAEAFDRMRYAAKKDGIEIRVISSFRDFNHQKRIWNNKFTRYIAKGYKPATAIREIIKYSTIPGTSRHHWGTDLDIIQHNIDNKKTPIPSDPLQEKFFKENSIFYPLKAWLNKNAERFGFYEVYTQDATRKGFNYEPWHFSYKPISKIMLKDFLKYDLIQKLSELNLNGQKYITPDFIKYYLNNYILGINKNLI